MNGHTSRLLVGVILACAALVVVGVLLSPSSGSPAASSTTAPSGSLTAAGSATAPPLASDCSTGAAPTPTPSPTPAFSPRAHGSAPKRWPATIEQAQANGQVAPDGTVYFVDGDYLLALNGSGKALAGWPQPLDFAADLNVQLAFGSDGSVYVWGVSGDIVDRFAHDGTRSPGFPVHGSGIQQVVPISQGVLVVSEASGSPECGDERALVTELADGGAVLATWPLQGSFQDVGPDGTIYSLRRAPSPSGSAFVDTMFAYDAGGAVKPGWPVSGYSGVTFDPSGRIYLSEWEFRDMPGVSMEGPGLAIETTVTAADATGKPSPGWPMTFESAVSQPAFGPDGTVYLSDDQSGMNSVLAFAPDGSVRPGWPATIPSGQAILRWITAGSAAAPDPPEIAPDGSVYVGTYTAAGLNGFLDAFDAAGRIKPGFPAPIDWSTISNIFFGYGSGWYGMGRTGLVYTTDDYTVGAVGSNGKAAPGWPVKIPDGYIITGLELEPDGGLLVEALQGGLADAAAAPLAIVGAGVPLPNHVDRALSVDFPGRLLAIRYLPNGTVAP